MQFECLLTNYIVPITTVFSNIMIASVPLVAVWMKYVSTNIVVLGQTYGSDRFYGTSYSVKLENKTLRAFVIDKVHVYVNKKQFFTIDISKLDFENRTLQPFKQLVIENNWTETINPEDNKIMMLGGVRFEVVCSNKIIVINFLSIKQKIKRHKLLFKWFYKTTRNKINNQISLTRRSYGDKVLSKQVKFAIHLYKEDGVFDRTILVCNSGFMNDCIFLNVAGKGSVGCYMLPEANVESVDTLVNYLKNELFKTSQQKFIVEEI